MRAPKEKLLAERQAGFNPFDLRWGQRLITANHEFWYRLTGGLVGGNFFGTQVLLLTTAGRKSGRDRTTPLTYTKDGDDYIVIASNGGSRGHPQWLLNLRADPEARLQVMDRGLAVLAHEAEGDERQRLWDAMSGRHPVYTSYERRTSRRIPVVVLRPT
jgi:deazaflavin-dependent oxidoreductase (nitroreductase family)